MVLCNGAAFAQFAEPLLSGKGGLPAEGVVPEPMSQVNKAKPQDFANSTRLPSIINPMRTTVYVYTTLKREDGERPIRYMVLTLRPTTLNHEQVSDINGILGINMLSGQQTIEADASSHQLELLQSILNPSANDSTLGLAVIDHGRKAIDKDASPEQWAALRRPTDEPLYTYTGPVPAAKPFARMFVIIGLAAATIYVAFAAYSIITGQAHGGNRVVAALAGLMLLLMGYTIYKIAVMNAVIRNTATTTSSTHLPLQGIVDERYRQTADTPTIPLAPQSYPPRSNMPVQPLSGR